MPLDNFSLGRRLRAGETVHIGWCGLPYPIIPELIAREGFVAVGIDSQHGLWDVGTIMQAVAAVRQAGAAPIVRIPLGDFALASRALDFGAEGVIAPMINTESDARAFVAATKFPPIGERSWGPTRALTLAGVSDPSVYLREANDAIVTFAMIETRTALDNLDAILAVPGLDAVFLGPSDLSITLSDGATLNQTSPDVEKAYDRVIAAAQKAKKIPGAYCPTADRAVALAKRGVRFMAITSDIAMLRAGAAAALKAIKG